MTTADKLEVEAKRLRIKAGEPNLQTSNRLLAIAERDEALAAAWRGLTAADEAIGDHVVQLTDGTWACPICKALNMINALEID